MQIETATNRLADPDLAYRLLIDAHRGLSDAESAALNSRLILILANQIGSLDVLRSAIELARSAAPPANPSAHSTDSGATAG
jgi:hypothetical protein